jgi:hypothetical protein
LRQLFPIARHVRARQPEVFSTMTAATHSTPCTVARLRELIAALDRRLPQTARASELHIARDSAALKDEALERLAELGA